jgi:signal transduction histidine kinase
MTKEGLAKWISKEIDEEVTDIDGLLQPLKKTELIEEINISKGKKVSLEYVFLMRDVAVIRVPNIEIFKAAKHSLDITRQLLAFARKQAIVPVMLDLNQTVEGMLTMLRRLIGEDINLAWRPETGLCPVKMDPVQVSQILANLCVNARDAIADVGTIMIETGNAMFDETYCAYHPGFVAGEYVLLAVSDEIRSLILHRAPAHELRMIAVKQGMRSLRDDGWRIVREGRTTIDEVIRNTKDEQATQFGDRISSNATEAG